MGRRIINRKLSRQTRGDTRLNESSDLGEYWDRLKNLIPAEVSALYIAGLGVVPEDQHIGLSIWAFVCLVFTILFISRQTQTVEGRPNDVYPVDWTHVTISAISFVIWVYMLGGPFASLGLYVGWIGTLLMLSWTFAVPFFYKGFEVQQNKNV